MVEIIKIDVSRNRLNDGPHIRIKYKSGGDTFIQVLFDVDNILSTNELVVMLINDIICNNRDSEPKEPASVEQMDNVYDIQDMIMGLWEENQAIIDSDYRTCPECGNILHDLYCSEHVCPCMIDHSVLHSWSVEGSSTINLDDSEFIDSRLIDYKAVDRLAMPRLLPAGVVERERLPVRCRIISTPFGDRIVFGCQDIGGIDYGKDGE